MKNVSIFIIALVVALGFTALSANQSVAGVAMPCNVVIEKEEIPDTGRLFDFQITDGLVEGFVLSNGNSDTVGLGIDDIIEIREDVPEGYTLEIECVEGNTNCGSDFFEPCLSIDLLEDGTGVRVECIDDDDGSCVFTNTLAVSPSEVPTLSEWGLIAMAGILGIIAFVVLRRKKATV